jgi:hypothetical protein
MHIFMFYGALFSVNQKANNGSLAEMYTAANFNICDTKFLRHIMTVG